MRIGGLERLGHDLHDVGDPHLIGRSAAFQVEIDAVEVPGLHEEEKTLRQCLWCGGAGSQLVER